MAADPWTLTLWGLLAGRRPVARWRPRWGAVALAGVLLLDLVPWSRSFLPSGHPVALLSPDGVHGRFAREAGDPAVWRATGGD